LWREKVKSNNSEKKLTPKDKTDSDNHDQFFQKEKIELKEKRKKGKNKSQKKNGKNKPSFGSVKGIETMFRSAYRAQLDLIAVGAMKANIMITINGTLATVLMISGAFIYAKDPVYLIPAFVFLITATVSIFFSIQAASPRYFGKGQDRIINPTVDDFHKGNISFLNSEQYAELSREDYVEGMRQTLQDPEKVYVGMIEYLHHLGLIANWNFKQLKLSYFVFRTGIVFGIIMLIAVQLITHIMPLVDIPDTIHAPIISNQREKFDAIYQTSGIGTLPDGRVLVIRGEDKRALSIIEVQSDGSVIEDEILDTVLLGTFNVRLEDLEALTIDKQGTVYAITSFRRTKRGRRIQARERLVQFKVDKNRIVEPKVYHGLGDFIAASGLNKAGKNIAIEGLTFDAKEQHLLVAFSQPLSNGKAIIMTIENPHEIFSSNATIKVSKAPDLLDLGGAGILAITYDPYLKGYLISSQPIKANHESHSSLWFWDGQSTSKPRRAMLPAIVELKNVEGMTPVKVNGQNFLMLISGDGNKKLTKPAHYMLLQYNQLIF